MRRVLPMSYAMIAGKQRTNIGEFDDKIRDLREQRTEAVRRLQALHGLSGDATEARRRGLINLISTLDATIAAYEDINAEGGSPEV